MSEFLERARRAHDAIKQTLLTEWDPIGVSEIPEAQDEYDAYVGDVYRLLSRRAVTQEVFDYLWWLEQEHMGLSGDRQRTQRIAERLVAFVAEGLIPGTTSEQS